MSADTVSDWNDLRREVQKFAMLMELALRENDHKPGWKHDDATQLLGRLFEETAELSALSLDDVQQGRGSARWIKYVRPKVGREAADVANFAMMIADVCGALK